MLNPNGIDPSPENQLFATAQSDFLPSPVGRGLRSGIPTWYANVVAMTVLFPPLWTLPSKTIEYRFVRGS